MRKLYLVKDNKIKKILVCPLGAELTLEEGETLHEAGEQRRHRGETFLSHRQLTEAGRAGKPEEKKGFSGRTKELAYQILAAGAAGAATSGILHYFIQGG